MAWLPITPVWPNPDPREAATIGGRCIAIVWLRAAPKPDAVTGRPPFSPDSGSLHARTKDTCRNASPRKSPAPTTPVLQQQRTKAAPRGLVGLYLSGFRRDPATTGQHNRARRDTEDATRLAILPRSYRSTDVRWHQCREATQMTLPPTERSLCRLAGGLQP